MKNQRKKLASLNFGPIWQYDALFQKINGGTIILEKKVFHIIRDKLRKSWKNGSATC